MAIKRRSQKSGRLSVVPWREDPEILGRLEQVARAMAGGKSMAHAARELGMPYTSLVEDWHRILELQAERAPNALNEHIASLRQQQQDIIAALEGTDKRSLNVGQLRSLLRQIEMDIAKLDGSLVERRESKLEAEGVTFTLNLTGSPG